MVSIVILNVIILVVLFNKDLFLSIFIIFLGKFNFCVIDFIVIKLVGDIIVVKVNEIDNGILGIRKCIKILFVNMVIKIKLNVRSKIGFLSFNSFFFDIFCFLLNSNGVMIYIINIFGLNENENLNGKIDNIIFSII